MKAYKFKYKEKQQLTSTANPSLHCTVVGFQVADEDNDGAAYYVLEYLGYPTPTLMFAEDVEKYYRRSTAADKKDAARQEKEKEVI